MSETEYSRVDVGDFLKSNSELFVVLGVFSALAIYISQLHQGPLNESPLETRVGFAGSLLLALLVLALVYGRLIEEAGSLENLIRAHARISNLDLIIFTTGILFLAPSLAAPLLEYQSALYYTLVVASLVLLIPVMFEVILILRSKLPENPYIRSAITLVLGVFIHFAAGDTVAHIRSNPGLVGTDQFSVYNLAPAFYDVLAVMALIGQMVGLLAAMVAVSLLIDEFSTDGEEADQEPA